MILQNQVYVMRHGQSENNVLGVESCLPKTQKKFGLTPLGQQQVRDTAHSAPAFDFIYSSPFRRAQETAAIMGTAQNLEIRTEPLLHEFRLPSEYDLQPYKKAEVMIHDPFTDLNTTPIGDSESFNRMYERIKKALTTIDQKHSQSTILLVSHGSPVEAFIQMAQNQNKGFGPFENLPKNAELIHLNSLSLIA